MTQCESPRRPPLARLIRFAAISLLLGSFWLATGCAHLPPPGLDAPELSISEIQISEFSVAQIRFSLSVTARNPNDVVLPFSRLDMDLELLGQPFAKGRAKEEYFELPPRSLSIVPIDFVVPTARVRTFFRSLSQGDAGRFDYRLKGSANWGKDGILLPFDKKGEMQTMKRLIELLQR